MSKKISEKKEGWMRILVGIVSGIILGLWKYLIFALVIINFFVVIFSGKRLKRLSQISETWNTQVYDFLRYMTFVDNKRPFPFSDLEKDISKFR
jgi:hypothetical protein